MEISNALLRLLKIAGMKPEELPKTIEECEDELLILGETINDIKSELFLDSEVEHRTEDWRIRATHALRAHQRKWSAIKKYKNALIEAEKKDREPTVVENVRAEMQKALDARNQKIARIQRAHDCCNHTLHVLKRWVQETRPDSVDEMHALVSAAQSAFDARSEQTKTES